MSITMLTDGISELDYAIPRFVTAGFYGIICFLALIQLTRIQMFIHRHMRDCCGSLLRRQSLCIATSVGAAVRVVWFVLTPLLHEEIIVVYHATDIFLNFVPTYIFVSVYTLVLVLLVEIYHSLYNIPVPQRLNLIAVLINVAMWVIVVILFFLEFFYYTNGPETDADVGNAADWIMEVMFIVLFGMIGAVFLFFGIRVRNSKTLISRDPEMVQNLRRIVGAAVVCTIAFACRSVLIVVNLIDASMQAATYFTVLYYTLFDAIPTLLLLILIARPPHIPVNDRVSERAPIMATVNAPSSRYNSASV